MDEDKLTTKNTREKLAEIPRGNTCPGVNREIVELLLSLENDFAGAAFLDVPCGGGEFLDTIRDFFPEAETYGADIAAPAENFPHEFLQIDASREKLFADSPNFQIVTCISGVMEFDNTQAFFEKLHDVTGENGFLVVTNDNLVSVRDRILYLLFGRFRQYKLFIGHNRPTWKVLHLQSLLRILDEAEFETVEVRYAPFGAGEYVWLPLAAIIYALQLLYFRYSEPQMSFAEKCRLYPFRSLLSRHYVVVCRFQKR